MPITVVVDSKDNLAEWTVEVFVVPHSAGMRNNSTR